MNKKQTQKQVKLTKTINKNFDLASDLMPKGEKIEASLMHTNRFEK